MFEYHQIIMKMLEKSLNTLQQFYISCCKSLKYISNLKNALQDTMHICQYQCTMSSESGFDINEMPESDNTLKLPGNSGS